MPWPVDRVFEPIGSAPQSTIDAALATARSVAVSVTQSYSSASSNARAVGDQVIGQAIDTTNQVISQARAVVSSLGTNLISGLNQVRQTVVSVMGSVASSVASGLGTLVSFVTGALSSGLSGGALSGLSGLVAGLGASLVSRVQAIFGMVSGALSSVAGTIGSIVSSGAHIIGNAVSSLVSGIGAVISSGAALGPVGWGIVATIAGVLGNFTTAFMSRTLNLAAGALGLVGRAVTTISATLAPVISGIGGIVGGLVTALRTGLGTVVSVAKSAFGTLSSWVSSAWSFASSLGTRAFGFVAANIGPLVSGLSSLTSTVLSFGLGLTKMLGIGAVIGAFTGALYSASKAAIQYAQNAKDLSGVTGFGLSRSAGILNNFGAQGIGASAVQGVYANQSPFVSNLKTRAFGLPNFDAPNFGEQIAKRFQSMNLGGPLSQMMGQSMMRTLGLNSPEFLRLANTSPATQRQNSNFANQINANLGLNPSALARFAEAIPASLTRIGVAFQSVTLLLAGTAAPMIERVLDTLTKVIGDNAGNIAGFVERACNWMFSSAPKILMEGASTVLSIVSSSLEGFVKFGGWFVANIADVLGAGASTVSSTLRTWADSFSVWGGNTVNSIAGFLKDAGSLIGGWISTVGSFIADQMSSFSNWMQSAWSDSGNPFRTISITIAKTLDGILNGITTFVGNLAAAGAVLGGLLRASVLGDKLADKLGLPKGIVNPSDAYNEATKGIGTSDIEGTVRRVLAGPALPRAADSLARNATDFRNSSIERGDSFKSELTKLAESVQNNGLAGVGGISSAMRGAGGFLASPDGKTNKGRDFGEFLSTSGAPALKFLENTLAPGVRSLSDAAMAYKSKLGSESEREGRWAELISATREVSSTIRDEARRTGSTGNAGADKITAYMLGAFAQEQGRAVNSYGGGGTN